MRQSEVRVSGYRHIVEQGEGSPGERENSHYERFRSIREHFNSLVAQNCDLEPTWPSAELRSCVDHRSPTAMFM